MAKQLFSGEHNGVDGELRFSDGTQIASRIVGACDLITPDTMMMQCYPVTPWDGLPEYLQ